MNGKKPTSKTAWQKDPFKRDAELDPMRDKLNEAAKEKLDWLFLLTQSCVFYFVKNLVEMELRADITKRISERRKPQIQSWSSIHLNCGLEVS